MTEWATEGLEQYDLSDDALRTDSFVSKENDLIIDRYVSACVTMMTE